MTVEKQFRPSNWILGFISLSLISVFYWDFLTGQTVFAYRDIHRVYLPIRRHFVDRLLQGEWPEWYPFDGFGSSYVGHLITGVFHPAVWLHVVLPHDIALGAGILLFHILAIIGVFSLLRLWGCSRVSSGIGGFIFTFSGFLISCDGNPPYLYTSTALLWAIYGFERTLGAYQPLSPVKYLSQDTPAPKLNEASEKTTFSTSVLHGIGICSVAMASIVLAGDPQTLYGTSILLFVMALCSTAGKKAWHGKVTPLIQLLLGGGIAIALSACQLLPSLLETSSRDVGEEALAISRQWSLHPLRLIELIAPGRLKLQTGNVPWHLFAYPENYQDYWLDSHFLGGVIVTLALVGWIKSKRRRECRLLLGCAIVSLVISLGIGESSPGYHLFQHILPDWSMLRTPEKSTVFFHFAIALLAGLGCEAIQSNHLNAIRTLKRALVIVLGISMFLWGFLGTTASDRLISALFVRSSAAAEELQLIHQTWAGSILQGLILFILGSVFLWHIQKDRPQRNAVCLIAGAIIPLTLGTYGISRSYRDSPNVLHTPPPTVLKMNDILPGGLYGKARFFVGDSPPPPLTDEMRRSDASGLSTPLRRDIVPLHMGGSALFNIEESTGSLPTVAQGRSHQAFEELLDAPFFDGFNIRFSQRPVSNPATLDQSFTLLERPNPAPRIRLAQAIAVKDIDQAIAVANGDSFDVHRQIPVEVTQGIIPESGPSEDAQLQIITYAPERIELVASSQTPCALFVADSFKKGWTATVDGISTGIFPGLVNGRAIAFPAGQHRVVMTYKTPGLRVGLAISVLAWTCLIGFFTLVWWRRRQSKNASQTILAN